VNKSVLLLGISEISTEPEAILPRVAPKVLMSSCLAKLCRIRSAESMGSR
jgi:hypothetical protein